MPDPKPGFGSLQTKAIWSAVSELQTVWVKALQKIRQRTELKCTALWGIAFWVPGLRRLTCLGSTIRRFVNLVLARPSRLLRELRHFYSIIPGLSWTSL